MKKKIFIIFAALAALTMAGCASTGGEIFQPPADEEISGETSPDNPENDDEGDIITPDGDIGGAGNGAEGEAGNGSGGNADGDVQQPENIQTYKKYVTLTADGVNIRKGAGTSYASLGAGEEDTSYVYLGEENGWYKIYYKNTVAYISKKYSKTMQMKASTNDTVEEVIDQGHKLLGTKYVYGAVRYHDGKGNKLKNFTISAFDCSSLMQYMFYMGADGHLLAVTTRTQVVQGKTVARSDLQRGDLMFFTNAQRYNKTGTERIGHVALYLGDNLILHTASDYAKIEEISATRWKYYIQSQRMV